MNRREFIASSGASAVALGSGCTPGAAASGRRALMKLGCQSAPTNETHLQYLARYGVRNICGYPETGEGRLYATVDELRRLRDLAERNGISIDCIAPPFLASTHIDETLHPAIMLANSPERRYTSKRSKPSSAIAPLRVFPPSSTT
jgi:mannonate dehydratase